MMAIYLSYAGDGWVLKWKQGGKTMRLPGFESESAARAYAKSHGIG